MITPSEAPPPFFSGRAPGPSSSTGHRLLPPHVTTGPRIASLPQVSTAEFTLQLYVDGNYSNATELGIDLIKDNGEILSLTDNAHLDFWWNTSSVGIVRPAKNSARHVRMCWQPWGLWCLLAVALRTRSSSIA